MVKAIAEIRRCTERQAQYIYRDGVRNPKVAKELVALFPWTTLDRWFTPARRPGPRDTLIEWVGRKLPGYNFADFALDDIDRPRLAVEAGALLKTVAEVYRSEAEFPRHFASPEALHYAMSGRATRRTVRVLWDAFMRWRISSISTDALTEVEFSSPLRKV